MLNFASPVSSYLNVYINKIICQVPVAHAYNPSYSGGRDQEDHGLKPASPWQIVLKILFWKKLNTKKVWWSGSSGRAPAEALSSNSSTTKN
jgi:hypothetical protein